MTFRPGPLRAAAALAVGFVVIRVVYRMLFHGADGDGPVLLALPSLRLPAPFAHLVMFGPVTADGLWDAAVSALPIAVGILAFGVVNAVVDVARVFARASRRGPLEGLARALAIAWATLPSLAEAARAVAFAQRLRGERRGVRMLVPLLQRTLERAGALAAALELRGFAGRGLDGACDAPVEALTVSLGFGGGDRIPDAGGAGAVGLRVDDLTLSTGSLTLLSGPTGSGKSTLLRALAGLHTHVDGGWLTGNPRVVGHDRRAVPPRDLAQRVGVVLQHPREAFVTDRVRDEIGLALELRGVAPMITTARVAEVAGRVGVTALLDRSMRGLSAGEATLVAIAAAVVEHPILLLVDEPLADLDGAARGRVVDVLHRLAHEAGVCVVVAEHRVEALTSVADRAFRIDGGTVVEGLPRAGSDRDGPARGLAPPRTDDARAVGDAVLRARAVTVRHRDLVAVAAAELDLLPGEVVALVGPNGAGKSSLLAALALPPRGSDVVAGGRVALVPDASDDLFVHDSVAAECERADRRAARTARRRARVNAEMTGNEDEIAGSAPRSGGSPRFLPLAPAPAGTTAALLAAFLGLEPESPEFRMRLARHPRDLSVGERRCLALAIQLATRPRVLLVDEPTRGLDPAARAMVCAALVGLAAQGAAVLIASHEPEVAALADRVLTMDAGVLAAAPASRPDASLPAPATAQVAAPPRSRIPAPHRRDEPSSRPAGPAHPAAAAAARRMPLIALLAANAVALASFCWPLVAAALPQQAHAAVPIAALALAPLAALVVVATLDGTVRSAHMLALLGTLAAIGAAVRIAGTGAGGVEAVFILLILAGRAFGARFGMLLGLATIVLSTAVTGSFGPWTPFQMFACGWVGAMAGLLPRRVERRAEIAMLCGYGVAASYVFGLLMNLWFWPFAVGYGTGISYEPGAPLVENLAGFLLYSLVTSTAGWDTLRAVTTVLGILLVGRPVLAALRRAKPLAPAARPLPSRVPAPTP